MEFIINYYFDFDIISDEFGFVVSGLWMTIKLWLVASLLSLIWGLVLAVLRQLPGKALAPIRGLTIAYIDGFRGLPALLVLLLVSGFLAAGQSDGVLPKWLGLPTWFGEPTWFWYGVIGLTLTYGAYLAEVYRAGIEAIPHGQMEAARSLGMSHGKAMRYIIVPQAVRKVIPPLLNDLIALMKDTSLVFAIGGSELLDAGFSIESDYFNGSGLMLGAIFYLVLTIPLARLVDVLLKREQRRTQRGGGDADAGEAEEPPNPNIGLAGA
jgi:ABC-type amino acid transport system, permease component